MSRVAQSSFSRINDTVRDVADIVALVDRQTDGIAQSTSHIQQSVDSVKSGLSSFAADARANGGQLRATQEKLSKLELCANDMLDRSPEYYYKRNPATKKAEPCQTQISSEMNRRRLARSKNVGSGGAVHAAPQQKAKSAPREADEAAAEPTTAD